MPDRAFQNMLEKELTQAGLEPTISCSVGRRLIHWATEPWKPLKMLRTQKTNM